MRVDEELRDDFCVKVGVHQGFKSVLIYYGSGSIVKTLGLYNDYLVLTAEDTSEAEEKLRWWREGQETKGLRVNLDKPKIMTSIE